MPYFVPTEERVKYLIENYTMAIDEAQITEKDNFFYYITELEEIGPTYIMDDFGNAVVITIDMIVQRMAIYPPLQVLT